MESTVNWATLSKTGSILDENETVKIVVSANRFGYLKGTYDGVLNFTSNASKILFSYKISMDVPCIYKFTLSPIHANFDYLEISKNFQLTNIGNIDSEWRIVCFEDYISFEPSSGFLKIKESENINIKVDMSGKPSGEYKASFGVSNGSGHLLFEVPVTKYHHLDNDKYYIEGNVVDAKYVRSKDILMILTEEPNRLYKYDTSSDTLTFINLDASPKRISVNSNGTSAGIIFERLFSHIDLEEMAVIFEYQFDNYIDYAVITSKDIAFISPFKSIELPTKTLFQPSSALVANLNMVLHPSEKYIYGCQPENRPMYIQKIDIRNGLAEYLYDSRDYGNYEYGYDLWISDDGNLLFSSSGIVFSLSENEATDIKYIGILKDETIVSLDHSSKAKRIYTLTGKNAVRKYNSETFEYLGNILLPEFTFPKDHDTVLEYPIIPEGYYGFFNSESTKFYAIQKLPDKYNVDQHWVIVEINVE